MADAAHRIAEIAWRERNPAAGNFVPESDAGHHALVEAARLYVNNPAAAKVAVQALQEIAEPGAERVSDEMVDDGFEAAFPGLPGEMTVEEAKRGVRAALEAAPPRQRQLTARAALLALGMVSSDGPET